MTEQWPKGAYADREEIASGILDSRDHRFDLSLEAEVQTDKPQIKIVPCGVCKRRLVVSAFYAVVYAKCSACAATGDDARDPGSLEIVQAGRTDPSLATDLTKTLVNAAFARALCPAHPDDPEHEMELKTVNHTDRYGPKSGIVGETVMHQCLRCNATTTYSTTAVTQFRRCNEPSPGRKHVNNWLRWLGAREEAPETSPGILG